MQSRRAFMASSILAGGAIVCGGCAALSGPSAYERAVKRVRAAPSEGAGAADMRELVRCAVLAPSSHNTQCWKFRPSDGAVTILPDLSRRCPVVDPDDHHLFVSLGCAAENMRHAALAAGLGGPVVFIPEGDGAVRLTLEKTGAVRTPLYEAMPRRQSTRAEYDGAELLQEELLLLERAGTGSGVHVMLLTDRRMLERVLEYIIQGNTAQLRDPSFVAELKSWIRFSESEAVRSGDGLFSRCTGNPAAPRWLGKLLFDLFFTEKAENDKIARQVRSSAGIAVFVSEADDRAHWVEAGRAFERFALQATALGIRTAHLNQPAEVRTLRPQFASFLAIAGGRPDLIVRFGRGPEMPRSLRRPVEAVLVQPRASG